MNQLRMLRPEQAAKLAKERVAEFKAAQAEKARDAKRPAPLAETAVAKTKRKIGKERQEKLNGALILACNRLDAKEVRRLLKAGADPNARVRNELIEAGDKRDKEGLQGYTPLMLAAEEYGTDIEIVRMLIDAGADVDATTPNGWNALMGAAGFLHFEVATLLVGLTKDINHEDDFGNTVLDLMLRDCDGLETAEFITFLVKNGAKRGRGTE